MSLREEIQTYQNSQRTVDQETSLLIKLLAGRLRLGWGRGDYGTTEALKEMKKELTSFDARTGQFK